MVVTYNMLRVSVYECRNISLKTKFSMFKCCVMTAGVYGCAVWNTTVAHIKKLESCQFRLLRAMCGWSWRQYHSYEDIFMLAEEVGVKLFPIELVIRESRAKYVGHVERMADSRLPKILLHGETQKGARKQGGTEKTFRSVVKTDMQRLGIMQEDWQEMAQDRTKWRNAVVVDGRKFFMKNWWEEKRKKREERRSKRTESTSEYEEKDESRDSWRDTLNNGRLYHSITMAMAEGRITRRPHQHMKTDLTKGQYTIKHMTAVRLDVSDILGCMTTALVKAGDATGRFVTGSVKWKTKNRRAGGGASRQIRGRGYKKVRETGGRDGRDQALRPREEDEDWSGLLAGRDLDN